MFAYIDSEAHATYYETLAEAQAAWLAGRGEGTVAEVLPVHVTVARRSEYAGRPTDPASRASQIKALLQAGEAPMRVAERLGAPRQAVYQMRSRMRARGELPV